MRKADGPAFLERLWAVFGGIVERFGDPSEEMRPYVTVAIEANADLTASHRETGHLVWFAPDHAADGVTPLPGCPEYSLYTYDAMPDFWSWVEAIARDWQAPRS